jgi:predicted DNA-binding transcriptional regulator AlpA
MRARMLRVGEVCRRLGCCRSTLYQRYVRPGKLPLYPLGVRTVAALEADVERLVSEMVAKGAIDYHAPLHARQHVGKRCDAAVAEAVPLTASWLWAKP